jgi:hypothetical protein
MATYALYRYDHAGGGSKYWACHYEGGKVITRWGTNPQRLASRSERIAAFGSLEQSKLRKGYRSLGNVDIDESGNVSPLKSNPAPAQNEIQETTANDVYWTIQSKNASDEAIDAFNRLADTLYRRLLPYTIHVDSIRDNTRLVPHHRDRKKVGILVPEDGVYHLLYLMALKQSAPAGIDVSLSSDDGVEIGCDPKLETVILERFGTTPQGIRDAAEAIGIMQKPINLGLVETDVQEYWFG